MDLYVIYDAKKSSPAEPSAVLLESGGQDMRLSWRGHTTVPRIGGGKQGRSGILLCNVSMAPADAPDGKAGTPCVADAMRSAKVLDIRLPEGKSLADVQVLYMIPGSNIQVPLDMYGRDFPSDIPWKDIDPGARGMVRYFNNHGLPTKMSCSGHPGTSMKRFWVELREDVTDQDVARFMEGHAEPGCWFRANGMFCSRYDKAAGGGIVKTVQYTAPDMLDAMLDLAAWVADDMSGKPGHAGTGYAGNDARARTAAELCVKSIDPLTADALYRIIWKEHVLEDIRSRVEDLGEDPLAAEQEDYAAERYVYDGKYDCNLCYWDNIDNVIRLAREFA